MSSQISYQLLRFHPVNDEAFGGVIIHDIIQLVCNGHHDATVLKWDHIRVND